MALSGCASFPARTAKEPLPNFGKVNAQLYRGGQPTEAGLRQLAQMGIKTVVNLREENRSALEGERHLTESLGMRWMHLPMRAYWKPSDRQMRDFFKLTSDASARPIFLHCRRGRDRAGVMVAAYHVVVEGWNPHAAYKDALAHGMTRWNPLLRQVIFKARSRYAQDFSPKPGRTSELTAVEGG